MSEAGSDTPAATGGAAYVQLYVRASTELAGSRNEGRGAGERIPADVFARMVAAFEAPDESVREFERGTVVVDAADDLDVAAVWQRVASAWGESARQPPTLLELEQQRAGGQAANQASWMHAWDMGARRIVSEAVTQGAHSRIAALSLLRTDARCAAPPHMRAQLAPQLNDVRRQRMQQLQSGGSGGGGGSRVGVEQALAELREQLQLLAARAQSSCG